MQCCSSGELFKSWVLPFHENFRKLEIPLWGGESSALMARSFAALYADMCQSVAELYCVAKHNLYPLPAKGHIAHTNAQMKHLRPAPLSGNTSYTIRPKTHVGSTIFNSRPTETPRVTPGSFATAWPMALLCTAQLRDSRSSRCVVVLLTFLTLIINSRGVPQHKSTNFFRRAGSFNIVISCQSG